MWSSLFYVIVHPYAAPPVVTTLRPLQGTVHQRENAIFSCKAEGYPLPTISWMHKGMIVADGHPDYLISPKNEGSSSLRVASDLRIFSANVDKTGDVTCIATANTPEESRITFADHNASTSLTVLGMFFNIDSLSFTPTPPLIFPSPHEHCINLIE